MVSPRTVLPWLLGGALGLGGIIQGLHWKNTIRGNDSNPESLRAANAEISLLKRENESLRSLAQGGGEVAVPPDLIDLAEEEFELRFLSNPIIHRIAGEELRDRIAASMESRFGPSGIDDRQTAYCLIGWLRPEDDLLSQLTLVRSVGARGWFDEVTGEAWVTDRFDPENIPDQAALLRLLVRILLHQHFPPPPSHPGDDAARAREALHQGAATGAESRFYADHARAIGFVPIKTNPEAEQLLAGLPNFIRGLTVFPLTQGKGLADSLHIQGAEKLHERLRNPPQTTRDILQPGTPSAVPPAFNLPPLPDAPFLTDSAGQLGVHLWLEQNSTTGSPGEISASWINDRYALIPDGEASTAILWDIEFGAKSAADAFEAAAKRLTRANPPQQATSTPEERHLRVSRLSPTRVRFLNTATVQLADHLISPP